MDQVVKVALTGFMGVGKSSVARHLANIIGARRVDLDLVLEGQQHRTIAEIIDTDGQDAFRKLETETLAKVLAFPDLRVLSLGGGAWTIEHNRDLIRRAGLTSVWLESTFEHCWLNITFSRRDRPLARDKERAQSLFEERQKHYALADWHFVIKSGSTSYDVAKRIAEEMFD